ncbi:MAG TPA: post-COAP-1 domain-containing protein [Candidatus Bathyarchaeia archaeon]|nr:post-COAP-1 domain-containing protein [Candidatus Bathyarchaeia archaeon]
MVRQAIRIAVLFILVLSSISMLRGVHAANPGSGTLDTTNQSLTWTGANYVTAANADPSTCPPSADPLNVLCDHFFLNINLASNFWTTHTGTVTITITWPSGSNDFDLYIYRQSDGQLVGSSTLGGGETQEQVVLVSPIPGMYEARITPFLVTMSSYSGSAALSFTNGGPVPNPTFPTGGLSFGPATIVDPQRTEGEPLVHIDQFGNIWESGPWGFSTGQGFVAKSTDQGDSFHIVSPDGLRPNITPVGGGDSDIITDDQGFAYFADLEGLGNVAVAVTNDGGNNWKTQLVAAQNTAVDRQWLAVDNGPTSASSDNTIFLTYRQAVQGSQILSSPGSTGTTDVTGGLVFTNAGTGTVPQFVATGAPCGRLTFDPVLRYLYLPCLRSDHVEITRAHVNLSQRTGLTYTTLAAPVSPGGAVGHLFASLTTDQAGNVYVVWVDTKNNNVYLSSSTNAGNTWSTPLQVNGDPANTNIMPWAIAGISGTVDIVFYGTSTRGDPNSFPSWLNNRQAATTVKWFPYLVQVQGATTTPTIYQVQASEHPTDYGQICTQGLGCTVSGGDRTLADFFSVAIDANGAARIIINDLTNQHHGAALFELTQTAGPSAIGTTLTPANPNIATGVTDPAGDAQVPHYSPAGAGANQQALDLLSAQLSRPDISHLTVTLQLANLASLLPPTGSNGIVWLTRWQFLSAGDGGEESYRIFYMGANSTAGQTPIFFAGSGTSAAPTTGIPPGDGCVTTSPQNCKIIVYPNEKVETGTINTLTGILTITTPLADIGSPILGDTLFSVTALTFGHITHNPILQDADATRAFDYVLGQTTMPTNCPAGTTCKVTGGGFIFVDQQQNHGSFSIEVKVDQSGRIKGKVGYQDHATGLDFRTALITSAFFNGNTVTIQGTGTANGTTTNFQITVQDNDNPSGQDTFSIQLGTGYSKSGVLQGGTIEIH